MLGCYFGPNGIRSGYGIISPFYGDLQPEFILSLAQVLHSLFAFSSLDEYGRHWYKDIPVRRLSTAFSGLTLILMIAGSGVVWVFAYNGITDSFYNSGPYLTWSTNQDPTNSITVCWYSAIYTGSVVHYGLNITNLNLEAQ